MHCFRVKKSSIVLHGPCNASLPARAKSRAYLEALEQALDTTPIETFWERTRYPNSWHNFTTGNGRDSTEAGSPWNRYPTTNAVTFNLSRQTGSQVNTTTIKQTPPLTPPTLTE